VSGGGLVDVRERAGEERPSDDRRLGRGHGVGGHWARLGFEALTARALPGDELAELVPGLSGMKTSCVAGFVLERLNVRGGRGRPRGARRRHPTRRPVFAQTGPQGQGEAQWSRKPSRCSPVTFSSVACSNAVSVLGGRGMRRRRRSWRSSRPAALEGPETQGGGSGTATVTDSPTAFASASIRWRRDCVVTGPPPTGLAAACECRRN
jgi:hypothetical protein